MVAMVAETFHSLLQRLVHCTHFTNLEQRLWRPRPQIATMWQLEQALYCRFVFCCISWLRHSAYFSVCLSITLCHSASASDLVPWNTLVRERACVNCSFLFSCGLIRYPCHTPPHPTPKHPNPQLQEKFTQAKKDHCAEMERITYLSVISCIIYLYTWGYYVIIYF